MAGAPSTTACPHQERRRRHGSTTDEAVSRDDETVTCRRAIKREQINVN